MSRDVRINWPLVIAVALLALSAVIVLVALWWWAIAGMSQPIGVASVMTATVLGCAGAFLMVAQALATKSPDAVTGH